MNNQSVERFDVDINPAILERIHACDTTAYNSLWEANVRLVAYVAGQYLSLVERRGSVSLDDLIQSGYIALYKTVKAFDPERGMKFSTYAVFFIKKEIRRCLGIFNDKREPADTAFSLDVPLKTSYDSSVKLGDTVAAEYEGDRLEASEIKEAVRAAVGRIADETIRSMIREYYWTGKTITQIAEDYGVTKSAIGQRLHRGYSILRADNKLCKYAEDYGFNARSGNRAYLPGGGHRNKRRREVAI